MAISEARLDVWSKQGSVTQSSQTYGSIKLALEDRDAPYANKQYSIYLQGSYGNDSNVYADSDVDVVMCLDSTFYRDLSALSEDGVRLFTETYSDAAYGFDDFKRDVSDALRKKYGSAAKEGKKAIDVTGNGSRRDADVLVCAQFRRYIDFNLLGNESYHEGICFFLPDGQQIENFPKQHSENCTAKHQITSGWFKPTVRILKNLRNSMTDDGLYTYGRAPSYFLEGMLWNVPNEKFGRSYCATVANCLNWLAQEADRDNLVCANNLHYLLRDNSPITWNTSDFDSFLTAVCNFWNSQ